LGRALEATAKTTGAVALVGSTRTGCSRSAGPWARRWWPSRRDHGDVLLCLSDVARRSPLIAYVTWRSAASAACSGAFAGGIVVGLVEATRRLVCRRR